MSNYEFPRTSVEYVNMCNAVYIGSSLGFEKELMCYNSFISLYHNGYLRKLTC